MDLNKKETITIKLANNTEISVKGYLIRFDGHNHDFILHKDVSYLRGKEFHQPFAVTHKETGLSIPFRTPAFTKKDAITYAEIMMLTVTEDQFNEMIFKA